MAKQMVTIVEQQRAAKREMAMRLAVYPRQVQSGRMKPADAHRELWAMRGIIATLERAEAEGWVDIEATDEPLPRGR